MTRKQLDSAGVALVLDVATETVHHYNTPKFRDLYGFPRPDGYIGRSPCWWDTTIAAWKPARLARRLRPGPQPKETSK